MQLVSRALLLSTIGVSIAGSIAIAGQLASDATRVRSGAVFLMTNDASNNEIISFQRTPDGQLFDENRVGTGGRGSGGVNDPLQSQGSLTLSQNHSLLYAVNSGSGTVSVFRVNGAALTLVSQANSGGSEPLSIAENGGFVYVLNGAAAGSVVVFRWDDRQLRQIPNSTVFLSGTSAGGSSITVSPDRKWIAVTERLNNNIDIFGINADGTVGPIVVNSSRGPGVFAATFAPDGALVVSETGAAGVTNGSAISSYAIQANGTLAAISQSLPTLGSANCWNAITPNGKWVYASNAGSNNISGFAIGNSGGLTPIGSTIVGVNSVGGNLDIAVSSDGNYLYTQNSATGTVSIFKIGQDGSLTNYGEIGGLPEAVGFNGIAVL